MPEEELGILVKLKQLGRFVSDTKTAAKSVDQFGKEAAETAKQTDKVAGASDRASRKQREMGRASRIAGSAMKRAGGLALGAVGSYISISQIKGSIDKTVDLAKATLGLSRGLGLSAQRASEWAAVADVRGIGFKPLQMGFLGLSKNVQAALGGNKEVRKSFAALGITVGDLRRNQGNFTELLGMTADGFGKMEGGAKRLALGQKIMGKGFTSLLPMMKEGRQGIQDNLDMANKYGATLSGKPLKSMSDLISAQREMKFAQLGWQVTMATKVAPAITKLTGFLSEHMSTIKMLIIVIGPLVLAFKAVQVITTALNITMFASPIPWIIVGLLLLGAGLVIAYKRFQGFRNVVNTVFNWLKKNWPLVLAILTGPIGLAVLAIIKNWGSVKTFFKGMPGFFKMIAKKMGNALIWPFNKLIELINAALTFEIGIDLPGPIPDFKLSNKMDIPRIPELGLGGILRTAGSVIVGDAGRELLTLPAGASVAPLGASARAAEVDPLPTRSGAGGGAGGTQTIRVPVYLDRRMIAEAVAEYGADRKARR